MALRSNFLPLTGNLNGLVAGTSVNGNTVEIGDNARQKIKGLGGNVSVTANTATLTASFKWQVSMDRTTWLDVANGSQNAAAVVFTTGTSAAKTASLPAPDSVYGWRFCRLVLVTGVVTGAAGDLYSFGYNFRTPA